MSADAKTIRNAFDTWVEALHPSKIRARGNQLHVFAGGGEILLYLATPVPRDGMVTVGLLRLYTYGSWGGAAPTISVQRVGTKYVNSKATWDNKPAGTGTIVTASHASTGGGDLWEFNVAPILQDVADGAAWYGFKITSDSATELRFRSAQHESSLTPKMVVAWTEAPDAPTTQSPDGGQAVNAASPVVECDYTDTSGTTTLAAMQVLVSASSDMSAPWDSGEELASGSKARLDLATTTYPGLAEAGVAYWQIRVKDSSGRWSAYSDVASWSRTAKGTVVADSPSAATPSVTDYTPVVTWTPSKVQEKFQVLVMLLSTGEVIFDSGEQPGTATSWTVEDSEGEAVLASGPQYEVEVRSWDAADRIGTTDDPPYASDSVVFDVQPGAPAPVSAITFTSGLDGRPTLTVSWERATAPDAFTILQGGVPIATNLALADLDSFGGTSYSYTLTNVRPNVANDIGIVAIENGVASPIVSASGTVRVSGVWLLDKDGTRSLLVAKTGGSTFDLGEDGETIVPLGASEGVRITQGLRGYEGSVTGVVANIGGKTRDEWVDELLAMREATGKVRRLVLGTEVLNVVTWDMTVRPTGDSAPGMRSVSFEFMQVGTSRKVA